MSSCADGVNDTMLETKPYRMVQHFGKYSLFYNNIRSLAAN